MNVANHLGITGETNNGKEKTFKTVAIAFNVLYDRIRTGITTLQLPIPVTCSIARIVVTVETKSYYGQK